MPKTSDKKIMDITQKIKNRIYELLPDLFIEDCESSEDRMRYDFGLAEILRAIGNLNDDDFRIIRVWNLKETFDNQEERTKLLIGQLLGIEEE